MRRVVACIRVGQTLSVIALIAGCGGSEGAPAADPDAALAPAPLPDLDAGLDASTPADADTNPAVDAAGPISCPVAFPASCPDGGAPHYADVAPIVQRRCEPCHSPHWSGPWPLTTAGHLRDWADDVRTHLLDCTMPPPDAGIPITREERLTLLQWVRCGFPD